MLSLSDETRRLRTHWRTRRVLAALAMAVAGCTPGEPSGPVQEIQLGSLTITIIGLPGGAASVTITGPGGNQTVHTSGTVTGLTAGTYTISAQNAVVDGSVFVPSPATQTAVVTAGATTSVPGIAYALSTGSLTVGIAGLPNGSAAAVVVTGPNGFSTTLGEGTTLKGLAPGSYTIDARRVQGGGFSYDALIPLQNVGVFATSSPSSVGVSYALATGALAVVVNGLPGGTPATVSVSGPDGYQLTIGSSITLSDLAPGEYAISGDPVVIGPDTWTPSAPLQLQVIASMVPTTGTITYTISTGRLRINGSGNPPGSTPVLQVTGPNGFEATPAPGTTLTGLAAGQYTVTAPDISTGTSTYAPTPRTQVISVTPSAVPAEAQVTWSIATGSLTVSVSGVPLGTDGAVSITGPGGFSANLTTSATLTNLTPGNYTVTAGNIFSGPHRYSATVPVQVIAVVAATNPVAANVTYAISSGLIGLTISGLPGGAIASVTVTGPGGYQHVVTSSALLSGLTPGSYLVTAAAVQVGSTTWTPLVVAQPLNVPASPVTVPVTVTYVEAVGFLTVNITGLAGGVPATVVVTGPGGYQAALGVSQTLSVPVGTYTINATDFSNAGVDYTPAPTTQQVSVTLLTTSVAGVHYTGVAAVGLNLLIDGAYITQSVQTYGNTVPLVAGRAALLRVFVRANESNSTQPAVRARFYSGVNLVETITINAPSASVPLSVNESVLNSSWNATLDGSLLAPGLSMLIDVDPSGSVAESNESDNQWPVSGAAAALNVRSLSTLNIRFVPIMQSTTGLTGNISEANKSTYLSPLQRMFPVSGLSADVRSAYTTNQPALTANGSAAWNGVLSEINALRVAEGTGRHYYGVAKVSYTSGIAGLGYIGLPASMGWDHLPSATEVMAHELGHNLGRLHAPCGGPSGVDPQWPNATNPGAMIGSFGYDIVGDTLILPATRDLMSYCDPAWISPYTYNALVTYREANPDIVSARIQSPPTGRASSLLVWGRIEAGQLILEPAFEVDAPASLPRRPGPHRVEALDPSGNVLFSTEFEGDQVADVGDPAARMFAFAIPVSLLRGAQLDRLRLVSGRRQIERRAFNGAASLMTPAVTRLTAGRARVAWSPNAAGALIRNARTGEILSIARNGSVDIVAGADELDVILSDGVRSVRTRVRPQ